MTLFNKHKRKTQAGRLVFTCLLVAFLLAVKLPASNMPHIPKSDKTSETVWMSRPLLSYFTLSVSLAPAFQAGAEINPEEFAALQAIARQEQRALRRLNERSKLVIDNPSLSLLQKRVLVTQMDYNQKVEMILQDTDLAMHKILEPSGYKRSVAWIEKRWKDEHRLHTSGQYAMSDFPRLVFNPFAQPAYAAGLGFLLAGLNASPRTYRIFAAHYEAKKGMSVVALPDQCLKLANGGLRTCDSKGYTPGAGYSVVLSYKKTAGALVGESGPWNVDDNFWAGLGDPTPRRMFADLPLGMPEAQAAYFNGYNGGLDQYGRKVSGPYAIDISRKIGEQIGLPWGKNDWVTVSFLWTEGWGQPGTGQVGVQATSPAEKTITPESTGSSNTSSTPAESQGNSSATPKPTLDVRKATEGASPQSVIRATPAADGSITHVVQPGETLWAIAVAYGVYIDQLQMLNKLGATIVIYSGQKLVIKEAGPTWTPSEATLMAAGITPTITPTPTLEEGLATLSARRTERAVRVTSEAAATATAFNTHGVEATMIVTSTSQTPASGATQSPAPGFFSGLHMDLQSLIIVAAILLLVFGGLLLLVGRILSRH